MKGDLNPHGGQSVEERYEASFRRSELRAGLRKAQNGEVELSATRELRQVVPGSPCRILSSPPGVDRLRVRLHRAREGGRTGPVRRTEARRSSAPASGQHVRPQIDLGRRSAPGRSSPGRRARRSESSRGDAASRVVTSDIVSDNADLARVAR